jgi:hypothetical protein
MNECRDTFSAEIRRRGRHWWCHGDLARPVDRAWWVRGVLPRRSAPRGPSLDRVRDRGGRAQALGPLGSAARRRGTCSWTRWWCCGDLTLYIAEEAEVAAVEASAPVRHDGGGGCGAEAAGFQAVAFIFSLFHTV